MQFDLQPTLHGSLIDLRPLTSEDFPALFAAASDPLIWEQHPQPDRYKNEVFQKYFDGAMLYKNGLAIIDRATGRIIGSSRFRVHDSGDVEIGWTFLERAFWGGEYNRELKSLMLAHAFRFVDQVLFFVGEDNLRSQRAMEKIGAKFLKHHISEEDGRRNVVFVMERASLAYNLP